MSLIKSAIRMIGCVIGFVYQSLTIVLLCWLIAELFGLFEELFDDR
jgi:hypothetical protein